MERQEEKRAGQCCQVATAAGHGGKKILHRWALTGTLCTVLAGAGMLPSPAQSAEETPPEASATNKEATVLPVMTVKEAEGDGTRIIPTDVLQRTQALDMADVFVTEPSVNIGGGARNAQRIYLRGIEGSNLNISIDGAKQNTNMHQHRGGIGNIEPSLLKKVEVHPGPGADQGPGALGGSIRFETVDAQDLLEPGEKAGARIRGGYSTADEGWNWGSTAFGQADKMGFMAHASGVDADDYRAGGGGDMPNSATEDESFMAKFSLVDHNGHSLRLSGDRNTNEGLYLWGSTGSDNGIAPEGSTPVRQVTERETWVADYRYKPGNRLIDFKFNAYTTDNMLTNETSNTEYSSQQQGGDLRNTFRFNLGPTGHDLTLGLDYINEEGKSPRSFGTLAGQRVTNESDNLGLYLQDRMSLGRFGLSFGARLDDFEAEYGPNTFSGSEVSPNVGADYELIPGVTAFANYGEAVRASGLIPVGWLGNVYEGTNFNDGKPFEPERSQQIEGGVRYEHAGLLRRDDRFNAEISVFETELENTIERVGGGGGAVTKIWNNPDTVYAKGWELRLGWGLDRYDTTLAFTHVDTEDEHGDPISISRRKAAPSGDRLIWDNRWQATDAIVLGGTLTLVSRLDDVVTGTMERPGYTLVDLQAEYSPDFVKGLTLSLAVNNLLDHRYSEQTSIASGDEVLLEEGRDVRLMATYRF